MGCSCSRHRQARPLGLEHLCVKWTFFSPFFLTKPYAADYQALQTFHGMKTWHSRSSKIVPANVLDKKTACSSDYRDKCQRPHGNQLVPLAQVLVIVTSAAVTFPCINMSECMFWNNINRVYSTEGEGRREFVHERHLKLGGIWWGEGQSADVRRGNESILDGTARAENQLSLDTWCQQLLTTFNSCVTVRMG